MMALSTITASLSRLLQSMILEPESMEYAQHALTAIPSSVVQRLSTDLNPEACDMHVDNYYKSPEFTLCQSI